MAEDTSTASPREMPRREPGEDVLTWLSRVGRDYLGLRNVPPPPEPPPPPGQLRVPRRVTPFKQRLEEIYRGARDRDPGEEG